MAVTYNAGFNLYEGPLAERPDPAVAYNGSFYRATDTGQVYLCAANPPQEFGFSYQGTGGYYWNRYNLRLFAQQAIQAGDTIANATGETGFESTFILPANTLQTGQVVRVESRFLYNSLGAAAGTLAITFRGGAGLYGTLLVNAASYTLPLAAASAKLLFRGTITVATVGAAGVLEVAGELMDLTSGVIIPLNVGAGVSPFDTTANHTLSMNADFSVADVANTIQMRQFIVGIEGV